MTHYLVDDEENVPIDPPPPDDGLSDRTRRILSRPDVLDKIEQQARYEAMPRMAQPNAPLTDEARKDLYAWIRETCSQSGMTVQLAGLARVAPSVVSQLAQDPPTYKGDADAMLRKLEAAWVAWNAAAHGPRKSEFTLTQIARDIFSVAHTANKIGRIGVVVGPSGIGKTLALQALIASEFPSAVLIEVNEGCASPLAFMHAILDRVRRRSLVYGNSRSRAFNLIVERLKNKNIMLLIDEADQLSNDTLNTIRQIHDATGSPVVLVGRQNLMQTIERTRRDVRIGGSVAGRICVKCDLVARVQKRGGGEPLFSADEIVEMLKKFKVRLRRDGARWLASLATIAALGDEREGVGLRFAIAVFQLATVANPHAESITIDMLSEANRNLMGDDAADAIEETIAGLMRPAAVAASA